MPESIVEDCKLQDMFHKALELLPHLWVKAGFLNEAIIAYRRVLLKPWNLDAQKLAGVQKDLAATLLYGGVEASLPAQLQAWGPASPKDNIEEAIILLLTLMEKVAYKEIKWDEEIMDHLAYALTITGQFELLAEHVEQALPGTYRRSERWYFLALCYSAAGQNEAALNLLKKFLGHSEAKHKPHIPSFLLGAKLSSQDPKQAEEGLKFSRTVIESNHQHGHFTGHAHRFLGICYGNLARSSISDSERVVYQKESLNSLNQASSLIKNEDPQVMFNLGLEHAIQRNIHQAFDNVMMYCDTAVGNFSRGWKLLALILSAEQRLEDAMTIVDFALEEAGKIDQFELLRIKAVLQITQEQPKQAIQTYRLLLAMIQAQRDRHSNSFNDAERSSSVVYFLLRLSTSMICENGIYSVSNKVAVFFCRHYKKEIWQ